MSGYYHRKLQTLLDAPTPPAPTPTTPTTPGQPKRYKYVNCWLDEETQTWLHAQAKPRHLSRWIDRQVAANPLPSAWVDTRPDDLRQGDRPRLEAGILPLWTEGSTRTYFRSNLAITANTIAILCAVSDTYGIGPQQFKRVFNHYEGIYSHKLDTELTTNQKVSAVLRAWGGGYITPRYVARQGVK